MNEDPDDRRPRELRVHGVGGSPGPRLLGYDSPTSVEVVGEGVGGSVFIARRDDETVEGYDWGDLTSGSSTQPFWVLLLPFTVLNVAGWMHPPQAGLGRLVRAMVHVLSVLLTATFVFSLGILLVDLAGYQWSRRLACTTLGGACGRPAVLTQQWVGVLGGLLLLLVAALALLYIAGRSQTRFELATPPEGLRKIAGIHHRMPRAPEERLHSPNFFWHPHSAARLLLVHRVVLGASWLAVAAVTLVRMRGGTPPPRLQLDTLLVAVSIPAAVAIGLLWLPWLASLPGALAHRRLPPTTRAGPALAATLSFGTVTAVFSGTALVGIKRLSDWPARPGMPSLGLGAVVSLVDFWGGALIGIVVAVGAFAAYLKFSPHASAGDIPDRTVEAGRPLDGADPGWCQTIRSKRSVAWVAHHADWAALLLALGLFLTDVVAFLIRSHWFRHPDLQPPTHPNEIFYRVGAYGLTFLPLFVFQLVRKGESSRTFVSTIWDVLTFLPRRFSPLAVRCYAERAVPEFQGRVDYQVAEHGRPVLVSAHSQGSIIAFAALSSLPPAYADRVALVTYGSPITTIFARFFPEYFGVAAVRTLLAKLPSPADDLVGWRNYYRATDPIGGPVFPRAAGGDPPRDVELHDPMPAPAVPPAPVPGEAPLEHDRPAWTQIAVHSYYLNEPELKRWVAQVKVALAEPPARGVRGE